MAYTITAAQYANQTLTAAVLTTVEAGKVLASPVDRPLIWQTFQNWIAAGNTPLAYPGVKVPRRLVEIVTGADGLAGLNGLSAPQKLNLWTDFTTNNRWATDTGPNAAAILVPVALARDGIVTAAANNIRLMILAFYIQDNELYAVNPTFDPTINVPGTKVVLT